jgi:hypothetical protein
MIQFEAPCSSFLPLWALLRAIKIASKTQRGRADVRLTLFKGEQGHPDMLRYEVFQLGCYGLVEINEEVRISEGNKQVLHLNSDAIAALPEITLQDPPLRFSATTGPDGKVLGDLEVDFPDFDGLTDVQYILKTNLTPIRMQNPWVFPEILTKISKDDLEPFLPFLQAAKKTSPVVYLQTESSGSTILSSCNDSSGFISRFDIPTLATAGFQHEFAITSLIATLDLIGVLGPLEIGASQAEFFIRQGTSLYLLLSTEHLEKELNLSLVSVYRSLLDQTPISLESDAPHISMISQFDSKKFKKTFNQIDKYKSPKAYQPSLVMEPAEDNIKIQVHHAGKILSEFITDKTEVETKWNSPDLIKLDIVDFRNALDLSIKFNHTLFCHIIIKGHIPAMVFTNKECSSAYITATVVDY